MMNDIENRFIEWHLSMKLCLIAVFLSFYVGASWSANTLCEPSEKIVFSCAVNKGRYLSLCASSDTKKEKPYMQYRFGSAGHLEMQYPEIRDESQYNFFKIPRITQSPYSKERVGPVISYVGFRKGGFLYYIYALDYLHEGVAIYHNDKIIGKVTCRRDFIDDLFFGIPFSDDDPILPLDVEAYGGIIPGFDKTLERGEFYPPKDMDVFRPTKMLVGGHGEIYVSDAGFNVIKRVSEGKINAYAGVMTRLHAGGYHNDLKEKAVFNGPSQMAFDSIGNMAVLDEDNSVIRIISVAGEVGKLVGVPRLNKRIDSARDRAAFEYPIGFAFDSADGLYVLDGRPWEAKISLRKVDSSGVRTIYVKEIPGLTYAYVNRRGEVYYTFNWVGVGKIDLDGHVSVVYEPEADGVKKHIYLMRSVGDIVFSSDGLPFIFYPADGLVKRINAEGRLYDYINVKDFFKKNIRWGALAVDPSNELYIGVLDEDKNFYIFHASSDGKITTYYPGKSHGENSK